MADSAEASRPSLADELQRIHDWERRYAHELAGLTEADGSVRKAPPLRRDIAPGSGGNG